MNYLGMLVFTMIASPVFAQQNGHIVQITGNLDPRTLINDNQNDLQLINQEIEKIERMDVITVDINQLYSKEDYVAFDAAKREVNRIITESAQLLAEMRRTVYELDIDLQLTKVAAAQVITTQQYQQKYQNQYTKFLTLFLGVYDPKQNLGFNPSLTAAMRLCKTSRCVNDLYQSQIELQQFGQALNHRIELSSMKKWEVIHPLFKTLTIKDAVKLMLDELIKPNEARPVHSQIVRLIAQPAVAAITATAQGASNVIQYLNPKSYLLTKFEFFANPILRTADQHDQMEHVLNHEFALLLAKALGNPEPKLGTFTPKKDRSGLRAHINPIDSYLSTGIGLGYQQQNSKNYITGITSEGKSGFISLRGRGYLEVDAANGGTEIVHGNAAIDVNAYRDTKDILGPSNGISGTFYGSYNHSIYPDGLEGKSGGGLVFGANAHLRFNSGTDGPGGQVQGFAGPELGVMGKSKRVAGFLTGSVFLGGETCTVTDGTTNQTFNAGAWGYAGIGKLYISKNVAIHVFYAQFPNRKVTPDLDWEERDNRIQGAEILDGTFFWDIGNRFTLTGNCTINQMHGQYLTDGEGKPIPDGHYNFKTQSLRVGIIHRIGKY